MRLLRRLNEYSESTAFWLALIAIGFVIALIMGEPHGIWRIY